MPYTEITLVTSVTSAEAGESVTVAAHIENLTSQRLQCAVGRGTVNGTGLGFGLKTLWIDGYKIKTWWDKFTMPAYGVTISAESWIIPYTGDPYSDDSDSIIVSLEAPAAPEPEPEPPPEDYTEDIVCGSCGATLRVTWPGIPPAIPITHYCPCCAAAVTTGALSVEVVGSCPEPEPEPEPVLGYGISIYSSPAGVGGVERDPSKEYYAYGDGVVLTPYVNPSEVDNYLLDSWSIFYYATGFTIWPAANTYGIVINGDVKVTVYFVPKPVVFNPIVLDSVAVTVKLQEPLRLLDSVRKMVRLQPSMFLLDSVTRTVKLQPSMFLLDSVSRVVSLKPSMFLLDSVTRIVKLRTVDEEEEEKEKFPVGIALLIAGGAVIAAVAAAKKS